MEKSVACTLTSGNTKEQLEEQGIDLDLWVLLKENKLQIIEGSMNNNQIILTVMISSQISIRLKFFYQKIGELPFHMEILGNLLIKILQFTSLYNRSIDLTKDKSIEIKKKKGNGSENNLYDYNEKEIDDVLHIIFPPPVQIQKLKGSGDFKNSVDISKSNVSNKKRAFGRISR